MKKATMFEESEAMKEIRNIRDKNYEQIKNMSTEEKIRFFREKAQRVKERLKKISQS